MSVHSFGRGIRTEESREARAEEAAGRIVLHLHAQERPASAGRVIETNGAGVVDIGTRQQIFAALRAEAAKGMSVIVASTDYDQLAAICDRVVIFRRGVVQGTLKGEIRFEWLPEGMACEITATD